MYLCMKSNVFGILGVCVKTTCELWMKKSYVTICRCKNFEYDLICNTIVKLIMLLLYKEPITNYVKWVLISPTFDAVSS